MKTLIHWLETDLAPKLTKVNHNVWVVTLKDSIMQTLPRKISLWGFFNPKILIIVIALT